MLGHSHNTQLCTTYVLRCVLGYLMDTLHHVNCSLGRSSKSPIFCEALFRYQKYRSALEEGAPLVGVPSQHMSGRSYLGVCPHNDRHVLKRPALRGEEQKTASATRASSGSRRSALERRARSATSTTARRASRRWAAIGRAREHRVRPPPSADALRTANGVYGYEAAFTGVNADCECVLQTANGVL